MQGQKKTILLICYSFRKRKYEIARLQILLLMFIVVHDLDFYSFY